MLQSIGDLISGIFLSIWGLLTTVTVFVYDLLMWLHLDAPRLEGLLIGILLAWLLQKRDSHPILKMLSAPLKLVIDILDLAWNQTMEFLDDGWTAISGWTSGVWGWTKGKVLAGYNGLMSKLRKTKEDLK